MSNLLPLPGPSLISRSRHPARSIHRSANRKLRCDIFSVLAQQVDKEFDVGSKAAPGSKSFDETISSLDSLLSSGKDESIVLPLVTPEIDAASQLPQDLEIAIGPGQKEKEILSRLFDGSTPLLQELRETPPQELFEYAKAMAISQLKNYVKPTHIVDEKFVLPRACHSIQVKPRFSYLILALNLSVYAYGLTLRFTKGEDAPLHYFDSLANLNAGIESGEYYRLLTSNFLHDSFVHLAVSSYALFTIAPEAESILGILAFLTTYILGGVAGSGLCFLLTDTVTVGASTGIFGLIGAMGSFLYKNHRAPQASDQVLFAIGTLLFNLFLGGNHETAVDNLGHFGGLVCGIYLGYLLTPLIIQEDPKTSPEVTEELEKSQSKSSFPVDLKQAAEKLNEKTGLVAHDREIKLGSGIESISVDGQNDSKKEIRVYQPDPFQSLIVLFSVSLTLGSGIAATVLHRTGELPLPKWPVF